MVYFQGSISRFERRRKEGTTHLPIQTQPIPETAQEAISALQRGNKAQARELLEQALADHPHDKRIWMWLAWAAETEAKREEYLRRLLELDPDNQVVQQWLAGQRDTSQQMVGSSALERMVAKAGATQKQIRTGWRPTRRHIFRVAIGGLAVIMLLGVWWFLQRSHLDDEELRQGYFPLLSLRAAVLTIEETAQHVQSDEASDLTPYLGILIDTKAVILKVEDDLDERTPPYPPPLFAPAWQEARRAVPTLDDVLDRWVNQEITASNIPVELAPVRAQIDHSLTIAEEALARRYGADRDALREIREELLTEIRGHLQETTPTPAP